MAQSQQPKCSGNVFAGLGWANPDQLLDGTGRKLSFPVLRFEKDGIQVFRSARALSLGTKQSFFAPRERSDVSIVDSKLREFPVLEMAPVRRSWHIAYWGGPVPIYILAMRLGDPQQRTFEEVRHRVIEQVVRRRWYRQGGQSRTEFEKAFIGLASWKDLTENISLYGSPSM